MDSVCLSCMRCRNQCKVYESQIADSLKRVDCLNHQLFSTSDFVCPDILFECLVDTDQTKFLTRSIDEIASSSTGSDLQTLSQLIGLRQSLLDHIISVLVRDAATLTENASHKGIQFPMKFFSDSLDFSVYLCLKLPTIRRAFRSYRGNKVSSWVSTMCLV